MILNRIDLKNFRSYQQQTFCLHPNGNLFIGANGSGKTNLMEAIAYTSIGKSIRYTTDEELMAFGQDFFAIDADFCSDLDTDLHVQLSYAAKKKILKVNHQLSRQLSTLFSVVKVIYCAPEDLLLVGGSPRLRRQYFDLALSQLFPDYLVHFRDYLHVIDQRNNLLKRDFQSAEKKSWDLSLAKSLVVIYAYRKRYLEMLNSAFLSSFAAISDTVSDLQIDYRPVIKDAFKLDEAAILGHLSELEPREKMWQRTLVGAHLDDYSFRHKHLSLRAFGSQGQKRITVIVLKLIQANLIESVTRIKPILLFDDIFAELDTMHSHRIRELCNQRYQIFIASPKKDIMEIWPDKQVITIGEAL